jgi:DNA-binding CsgD family transcriptional regulator
MFRLLGVQPGPDIGVRAAAALADVPVAEARRLLRELADAHLTEQVEPGRYRTHDLLRAYARKLAGPAGDPTGMRRIVGFYLHTAAAADRALNPARGPVPVDSAPPPAEPVEFATYDEALRWCQSELSNAVATVREAAVRGPAAGAWQLANALWSFFYLAKFRAEWVDTHRTGLRAAEAVGDVLGQARMRNGLAAGADLAEAIEQLRAASALFRSIGDRRGEASAQVNLADAYLRAGRPAESVPHSLAALDVIRGTGTPYVEAAAVCNLGEAYLELGRSADAVASFTDALALCRTNGNRVGEAVALVHLGEAYVALRRHDAAVLHLTDGLRMCRDNGDRRGEVRALLTLGTLHRDTRAGTAARTCWEQALEILTATGDERAATVRDALAELDGPDGPDEPRSGQPLTPAEERVARLVASGRTNREVAQAVRLSPKTVEVNLSRVYRKLGIRNRTELANRLR